ncbi:uncharacterized protein MELLADRAFT_109074 [Melampsora larici-populina 98AG31]|uniref:Uncharacterized protein n=1 Tax=Melampsora larici-populina (strain 98AG31 / pathotype 3-4-7) TaxID=747676 RepID=F4RV87_MELLP|nr:uncharacterized protein MELLADRAFT_109074 [Melampsora larici-populina 98AG31]EGG03580.1 hypothetical protein MELLADRAFT_109074 [Melampsora larici-populina 98AG31]
MAAPIKLPERITLDYTSNYIDEPLFSKVPKGILQEVIEEILFSNASDVLEPENLQKEKSKPTQEFNFILNLAQENVIKRTKHIYQQIINFENFEKNLTTNPNFNLILKQQGNLLKPNVINDEDINLLISKKHLIQQISIQTSMEGLIDFLKSIHLPKLKILNVKLPTFAVGVKRIEIPSTLFNHLPNLEFIRFKCWESLTYQWSWGIRLIKAYDDWSLWIEYDGPTRPPSV